MCKTLFIARLVLWLLLVCFIALPITAVAGEQIIRLAATADLHGNCARISGSVSQQIRKYQQLYPRRVIYVDSGDTAQGSGAVNRRRGSGVMTQLARAGCMVWVPGNHDLEFGPSALARIIREFPHTVLAANLDMPELSDKLHAWKIIEISGIKIAFIGLTVNRITEHFPVDPARLRYLSESASLLRAVQSIRAAGADMIVLIRHAGKYGGGMNLAELLKMFPEIDLVIGGHSHIADPGSKAGSSWFVQPPPYGKGIAEVRMIFDKSNHRLKMLESRIVELPDTPENNLDSQRLAPSLKGETADFSARKIRQYMKSDLALYFIEKTAPMAELLDKEQPTVGDYYKAYPYFDAMVNVQISGEELIEILQEYVKYAHSRKGVLVYAGFRFDTSGSRLRTVGFEEIKAHYCLSLSAFASAGAGGKLPHTRQILRDRIDVKSADQAPGILDIVLDR
jgi:2',3'-cyclic-nucleotide 2'-phosphodiesterase (5'-nucleotidase family)